MASTTSQYRNQATQRVLALLSLFIGLKETLGVSELSRVTGMNKNMVHRMLTTLVEAGYVVRDRSGERYQLGYRILDLHVEDQTLDLRALCRPFLERLHAFTSESVFLSIVVGASRVNVDWIEAQGRRVSFGQRGRSVPLHCTKMSRLLLAHLSDTEITHYLASAAPLEQSQAMFPDPDFVTEEAIREDIRTLRGADHITWRSATQFGGAYISFPIPGADGRLHGIITIGGPMERFEPEKVIMLSSIRMTIEDLRRQCFAFVPPPVVVAEQVPL